MSASRVADVDELLFAARSWFAIDGDNRYVGGVVVPSLTAGLALIGHDRVAAIVGRVRDEIRVVDIDLDDDRGVAAAETLSSWCRDRGLWCLVRPSGGALGRHHVFVAHGGHLAELHGRIEQLRNQLKAPKRALDVRTTVRALSSPHRSGTVTRPQGRLAEVLAHLRRHQWAPTAPNRAQKASQTRAELTEALVPARRRQRRPLPAAWQTYLEHGTPPPITGGDQTRSAVELVATATLIRAGHDAESAWATIAGAHPGAFVRARANRRRWVAWVWNAAVETDNAFTSAAPVDQDVLAAVEVARTRLRALAWSVPPRQRPALLLVGHTVLDRAQRTGQRRVPVPERDLVLDTGLADRKTIRAQLRAMDGLVGVLHVDALDPARRAETSFEFEIPAAGSSGVSQLPPPSSHTPYAPPGLWAALPPTSHQLWRTLTSTSEPHSLLSLTQQGQLTPGPTDEPTASQVRTTRAALTALAEAGLAHCSASGHWFARAALTPEHHRLAAQHRAPLEQAVAAERTAYRAPAGTWHIARAAALKANRAREVGWWTALPHHERIRRRTQWQETFAGLSVVDQEHRKTQLAERRLRAGVSEPQRHDTWLDALSWDDYTRRSTERAAWFGTLPSPMRQALASSWARHRGRYGIARGTVLAASRREHSALPDTNQERDAAFWATQTLPMGDAAAGRSA